MTLRDVTRNNWLSTELTIMCAYKHTRRHEWYTDSGRPLNSAFRRRLRMLYAELYAECRGEEVEALRRTTRVYEKVVETLIQRICEDGGQMKKEVC